MYSKVLFYALLSLFIIDVSLVFCFDRFRKGLNFWILVLLAGTLIYLSQSGSNRIFKFGLLEIITEAKGNQGKFEIKNSSDKGVQEEIKFATSDMIKNLTIDKGDKFISIVDGGIGNNYIVYSVNIPPNQVASGSIVSVDTLNWVPQILEKKK